MSNESDLLRSELLRKVLEAWETWEDYHHTEVMVHFYKEKVGRAMKLLNPWTSIEQRIAAEEKDFEYYKKWLYHYQTYVAKVGEHVAMPRLYVKKETPNGERWIKRSTSDTMN